MSSLAISSVLLIEHLGSTNAERAYALDEASMTKIVFGSPDVLDDDHILASSVAHVSSMSAVSNLSMPPPCMLCTSAAIGRTPQ